MGSLNWKDIGLNAYGNSLIVNGAFLEKHPKLAENFVRITQKAYAACVADFEPCLKALLDQATGLDREEQQLQWKRIKYLVLAQLQQPFGGDTGALLFHHFGSRSGAGRH